MHVNWHSCKLSVGTKWRPVEYCTPNTCRQTDDLLAVQTTGWMPKECHLWLKYPVRFLEEIPQASHLLILLPTSRGNNFYKESAQNHCPGLTTVQASFPPPPLFLNKLHNIHPYLYILSHLEKDYVTQRYLRSLSCSFCIYKHLDSHVSVC